ncbi:uncharacterized protein [Rutidosis leptorrhynchoides]|uniref:uncharacterized protein n=1 Tax=Rutidosis leptorrhynchoides TaxID=125765 RepID=UPI003A9A421E
MRATKSSVEDFEQGLKKNSQQVDKIPKKGNTSSGLVTKDKNAVPVFEKSDYSVDTGLRDHDYDDDDVTLEDVRDDENEQNYNDGTYSYEDDDEFVVYDFREPKTETEVINNNELNEDETEAVVQNPQRNSQVARKRGPTSMPKVWNQKPGFRINIEVNSHGQHINENASKLTHALGIIARSCKHCPIYLPWTKVSAKNKQEMLQHLRTKFVIPEHANTWMLKSIGRKMKNWRARLKKKYWDSEKSFKKQVKSRPKEMQRDHWKLLVTYWNNERDKELSSKNKANRAKKKMVQLTGKKSYARIRAEIKAKEGKSPTRMDMFRRCFSRGGNTKSQAAKIAITNMDELAKTLPEGSTDKPGLDDVFSQVMGKNKYGAADMYGLGVRASDLWGKLPSRNVVCMENIQLKSENKELTEENVYLKEQLARKDGSVVEDSTTPQGLTVVNVAPLLKVGDEVFLHNILNPSEKVGRGWLRTLDPTEVIGGVEIGDDWCGVHLQHVLKKGADVVRPFDLIKKVEEATGVTIAWPSTFISVVPLN